MLGLAMRIVPALATVHAIATIMIGLLIAATRRPRDAAMVAAYITGSEVLWRLTRAAMFHEAGKYAIAAILFLALTRMRARRNRGIAIAYFILLLPSAALTFGALDANAARQAVSANLSGPLALTACVMFFSNIKITKQDVHRIFFALIAPVIGIATIVLVSTAAVREIKFQTESNLATSGGFGPNQVSAILGLALMFAVLILIERNIRWRMRAALIVISSVLAVQTALTFSRGGLLLALGGVLAAAAYLLRSARARVSIIIAGSIFVALGNYVIAPALDDITHGKIAKRYGSLDSNGRTDIALVDLAIFEDHPLFGVGPGAANHLRSEAGHRGAAHTEFTRMLSEHGTFGAFAAVLLVILGLRTFRAARTLESRALVAALLVWVALFLTIYAMRLVAPCFLGGLACAISYSSAPARAGPGKAKLDARRKKPNAARAQPS